MAELAVVGDCVYGRLVVVVDGDECSDVDPVAVLLDKASVGVPGVAVVELSEFV